MTPDAPSVLWLVDNSRKVAEAQCGWKRYLQYHWGPTGYGIVPTSESLPLVTGSAVHEGLAAMATILKATDTLPSTEQMRVIVARVQADYADRVTVRGYRGILAGPLVDETLREQEALLSGLLWALRLKFLPWLHETYRLLSIEEERLHFLYCSCGAGPLDAAAHAARGCTGIALMLRSDLLAQRRVGGALAYFEAKTTGWSGAAWSEQWETKPQLGLGTLDCRERFGAEVSEIYVLGLEKGARRREKADEGLEGGGRKKQQSALCYGYCRPGNPPLATDDWLPSYEWVTPDGETKRASRAHRKRGVWELSESDWTVWQAYRAQDPEMPSDEFWVRNLPHSILDKICFLVGPLNRQDTQIAAIRRGWTAGEQRWQQILWELYELQQPDKLGAGQPWASPAFQDRAAELIDRSWQCRPFGTDHQCEFVPICFRHQGWEDPLGSGRYQPRMPHHTTEAKQAIARGLLPAEAAELDEEGDRA